MQADTTYHFAPRPLCIFAVLYKGRPIPDFDGLPVEHGSHQAAEDHARLLADRHVTALGNFAVRREFI